MSRLTEWVGDGENRHAIPRTDVRKNGHQRCCNKLADYEDLEEQGRLIEQKHGQWDYNKYRQMYCSNCGQYPEIAVEWNYCPNCGAKMEREDNE